jgi:hypothetical protein
MERPKELGATEKGLEPAHAGHLRSTSWVSLCTEALPVRPDANLLSLERLSVASARRRQRRPAQPCRRRPTAAIQPRAAAFVWQRLPRQEGVEAKEAAMSESTQAAIGVLIVAVGITWSLAGVTGLVLLLMAVLVLGLEVFTDFGIGV